MKKLTLLLLLASITSIAYSQTCLPDGISFTTQEQIDNFQIDYPGCTEIEGSVFIGHPEYDNDIDNLEGLSVLTSIGGDLAIAGTKDSLTNLSGLENLTSIGGSFILGIDFMVGTTGNLGLTSLEGLDNLTTIGGRISIDYQPNLQNLNGLQSLTSIGYSLHIENNQSLTDISGVENIDPVTIEVVGIYDNLSLSECHVKSVCDYLGTSNAIINIHDNAIGCNTPEEVEEACASCLPEGITFTTQSQIDSFAINYPGCTEIEGEVQIGDYNHLSNINNLNGLSSLTSIGGSLYIHSNPNLINLVGLDNLITVNGFLIFIVNNASLKDLTGLEGLKIVNSLQIGTYEDLYNIGNPALTTLDGLNNIESISNNLFIANNDSLTNLAGLDNLVNVGSLWIGGNDALVSLDGIESLEQVHSLNIGYMVESYELFNPALTDITALESVSILGSLNIIYNNSLSSCDIQSVCDYLFTSGSWSNIFGNAEGCNSREEVEETCASSLPEIGTISTLSVSPNPFSTSTTIEYELTHPETVRITFYNQFGKEVDRIEQNQSAGKQQVVWTPELPGGVYYFRLKAGEQMASGKVVLVR